MKKIVLITVMMTAPVFAQASQISDKYMERRTCGGSWAACLTEAAMDAESEMKKVVKALKVCVAKTRGIEAARAVDQEQAAFNSYFSGLNSENYMPDTGAHLRQDQAAEELEVILQRTSLLKEHLEYCQSQR